MKKRYLYDVEVFSNFFCVVLINVYTEEITVYEISERKNDIHEIYKFFSDYDGFLIGFNSLEYDDLIVYNGIIKNYHKYKNSSFIEITKNLKQLSDFIINTEELRNYPDIKYIKNKKFTTVDFYRFWSFGIRQSKNISLKGLAIAFKYPVILESHYDFDKDLPVEGFDDTINYCANDVGILKCLLHEFKNELNIRAFIASTTPLKDTVYSKDNVKISGEIMIREWAKIEGVDYKEVKNWKFPKEKIYFKNIVPEIEFKHSKLKTMYETLKSSVDEFSYSFPMTKSNGKILGLSYGVGGIHSINNYEIYTPNENQLILTSDVQSLYPRLVSNYNAFRSPELSKYYDQIIQYRIEAKKNKEKQKDAFYKLMLNGVTGLLGQSTSPLYNNVGAMKMRVAGQLILSKLIDLCDEHGFDVISVNTDGLEVIVNKDKIDKYYEIIKEVEKMFNVVFEHEEYKKIVYHSVNSYVAITKDDKLKLKGDYFINKPSIENSHDFLVINKALTAYFTKGTNVEKFIRNHDNIYDFCGSFKVNKKFQVYYEDKKQQRLNRFYVTSSKVRGYLYKKDGSKMVNMLKGYPVILFNRYEEKPMKDYLIDYNYYIAECKKIISEFNFHQNHLSSHVI